MTAPLDIPIPRAPGAKDLEVRPKQVGAWLESLPLANAVEAARQLRDHLGSLNAARVDADDRLAILQSYRPVAHTVLDELEAIYAKGVTPLPPRAREALAMARDLAAALSTGHKVAVGDRAGKLLAFGARKHLPLLLYRAMEYVIAGLRAAYKSYTPPAEGLWRELHALFLYAEEEKLADEAVGAEAPATVRELYVEALLVALTDPYRLVAGEVDRVVAQVRAVKSPVALTRSRPTTAPRAHFLVPCDTDKPPKPALSASDDTGGPNFRILDANALVERLRGRRKAFEGGNVSLAAKKALGPDGVELLARLETLWGDPPKRSSRRDAAESSVAICVGLKSLAHYVSLQHRDEPAEADLIRRGITIPMISVPRDEQSKQFPVTEYDVVNQSPGGIKVRRDAPAAQPIAVGEAVGVKRVGRARWTIGVVRWITVLEEGGLEFGVQFLAEAARSVSIQPTIAALSAQAKQALLIDDSSAALLTTPNTYSDLREFEVQSEGTVSCVRATNLREKTARFELFEFSPS